MEENINTEDRLIEEISFPLYKSRNWLKIIGVFLIIYGAFAAISIVGILVAWLPIWIGIVCFQAGRKIEIAYIARDRMNLIEAQRYIAKYFTIYGVLLVIGLVFAFFIIALIFSIGLPSNFEDLNNIMQNDFY